MNNNNNSTPVPSINLAAIKDNPQLQQLLMMTLATINANQVNSTTNNTTNNNNASDQISHADASSPSSPTQASHDKRKHNDIEEDNAGSPNNSDTQEKPKSGRKPLTEEEIRIQTEHDPKSKRKLQNRQAQRAFRERRLNYVKELEDRIKDLEAQQDQQSDKLAEENQKLREVIQQLQLENAILGGSASSFDVPLSSVSVATERPQKLLRSIASDDTRLHNNVLLGNRASASPSTSSPETLSFALADADSPPSVSSSNKSSTHTPDTTVDDLFAATMPTDILASFNSSTQPIFDQPIFDSENPLGKAEDVGDIFSSLIQFDAQPPVPASPLKSCTSSSNRAPVSLSEAWDELASHPRFDDFDIDLLCSEMKNKAVCSDEHGDLSNDGWQKYLVDPTKNV
ncbi:hypothetical protein DM01DRAFT_1333557 [Hesseltinella vesiculosa]|uniref:BZIP domain-containing protein n=1 Tax=Hesseltinella vesiculosa TaxID=101127 RepID=A0A1X2GQD8_9FUNG|nr:hypothetical protein DM01DRAFT_1333557 [Hesseltinella vesiculosa]